MAPWLGYQPIEYTSKSKKKKKKKKKKKQLLICEVVVS